MFQGNTAPHPRGSYTGSSSPTAEAGADQLPQSRGNETCDVKEIKIFKPKKKHVQKPSRSHGGISRQKNVNTELWLAAGSWGWGGRVARSPVPRDRQDSAGKWGLLQAPRSPTPTCFRGPPAAAACSSLKCSSSSRSAIQLTRLASCHPEAQT